MVPIIALCTCPEDGRVIYVEVWLVLRGSAAAEVQPLYINSSTSTQPYTNSQTLCTHSHVIPVVTYCTTSDRNATAHGEFILRHLCKRQKVELSLCFFN